MRAHKWCGSRNCIAMDFREVGELLDSTPDNTDSSSVDQITCCCDLAIACAP
jgi:hypothetical protein